jgi:hypothetical protein
VAIYKFEGATIPSELEGLTVIKAGKLDESAPLRLSRDTTKHLHSWLDKLPSLAQGVPAISRVHENSGKNESMPAFDSEFS